MSNLAPDNSERFLNRLGWWLFFLVCVFYGVYAFYMGAVELLSQLDLAADAPHRATPVIFIIHAFFGGVALIGGPLQFNRRLLHQKQNLHRAIGRIYVVAIWIASIAGLWSALFFDVTMAAKTVFGLLAVLWFGVTTIAFQRIRRRKIKAHREWMMRSFSLSFFFVTFSLWAPALASTDLPPAVGYPLAVFLSWSLNLVVVEALIRLGRTKISALSAKLNLDNQLTRSSQDYEYEQ